MREVSLRSHVLYWSPVTVMWGDILGGKQYPIREILDWLESAPGGEYCVTGTGDIDGDNGFLFLFENETDATHFVLRWL